MAFTPPAFTGALTWEDLPSEHTPVNATDLNTSENAPATYAVTLVQALANYFEGGALVSGALTPTSFGRTSDPTKPKLRDVVSYKDFGVRGGARSFAAGGALTGGAAFADTTNAPFAAGDVGKTVILPGAGTAGVAWSTTIITFIDSQHVTLAAAPPNAAGFAGAYQFGWDDTAQMQSAETACSGSGCTLTLPADTYLWSSVTPGQNITRDARRARVYQIPGQANALWFDNTSDGTTVKTGFELLGGDFHGEGQNAAAGNPNQLGVVFLRQWQRVLVMRLAADGFSNSAVSYWNCRYTWTYKNNITNCCVMNYRNAIVITAVGPAGGSALNGDHWILHNYVGGNIPTAALSVNSEGGSATGRTIVQGNQFLVNGSAGTGSACIFVELNPLSGAESSETQVEIDGNLLRYTGTQNNGACIVALDDAGASAYAGDPYKLAELVISNNIMSSAANGTAGSFSDANAAVILYASRVSMHGNRITHTGTHGQALYVSQAPAATGVTQLRISNNHFIQTSTTAFNNLVRFLNSTAVDFEDNTCTMAAVTKGTTAGTDLSAVRVDSSCSNVRIKVNTIENAGRSGIMVSNANDVTVKGNIIRNPNASNDGSIGGYGIELTGAPTGQRSYIDNNTIVDNRGTHLMNSGIQVDTVAGSQALKPWATNNTITGSAFAPMSGGTNLANYGLTRNNPSDKDVVGPSQPTAPATGVALTSSDPFEADYYWQIAGGSMTSATRTQSGGSALAVGAANPVRLRFGDAWTPTYTGTMTVTKVPNP